MSQNLNSSQGSLEERYSHILQPIRDLAKNWDVDISHFLEEYLEDLEKIEITFDEGATVLNFSEAALLIQGSAGVYAKKVEYLHSLVYQVLDLVTQKKKTSKKTGEDSNQDGDDEQTEADVQLLPLDDISETDVCYPKEQDQTSAGGVRLMPEMPTQLIPLEEGEKGESCLYNKKGEMVGTLGDFNIVLGYISSDGSILLDLNDVSLLNKITTYRPSLEMLVEAELHDGRDDSLVIPSSEDHNDGVESEWLDNLPENPELQTSKQAEKEKTADAPRKSHRKRVTITSNSKPSFDPWALLDPYEKSKAVERPLLKKKPYRIPLGLDDRTTNKRKIKKEIKIDRKPLNSVVEKLYSHRPKFPKNPWKVPDFPELEENFWKEYKLRDTIKKEEIKRLKKEECEEIEVSEDEEENFNEPELPLEDFNDEIPQIHLNPDIFADPSTLRRLTAFTDAGFSSLMSDDITMSYEDLVQKHVEKFMSSAVEYAQITELSRRVSEWEEKIKPKLEEEEQHVPFDIHKYGTFIIEQLVRGEKKAFRELVKDKPAFEICRYTLATLQLANVYNVELSVIPNKSGDVMDCLYVTLLSTKRHFEDLAEYRAPSL